jgi:hypothetical protein
MELIGLWHGTNIYSFGEEVMKENYVGITEYM